MSLVWYSSGGDMTKATLSGAVKGWLANTLQSLLETQTDVRRRHLGPCDEEAEPHQKSGD